MIWLSLKLSNNNEKISNGTGVTISYREVENTKLYNVRSVELYAGAKPG